MKYQIFVTLFVFCVFVNAVVCVFEKPDHWVDPGDMLTFDPVTKSNRKTEVKTKDVDQTGSPELEEVNHLQKKEENLDNSSDDLSPIDGRKFENTEKSLEVQNCPKVECPSVPSSELMELCNDSQEDFIFMRRFVAFFLEKLSIVGKPSVSTEYRVVVRLHRRDWTFLEEFCARSDTVAIQEVLQKVEDSFREVSPYREDHNDTWFWKFEHYFHMTVDEAIKCCMVSLLVVSILTLEFLSRVSWSTQLKRFCVLMLIVSYSWTYIHQYQLAVAKRNAAVSKQVPDHCVNGEKEMTYFEQIKSSFRITFSTAEDPCIKHHKEFVESPFLTVTPTKVLAVTISEFVLEPLSHFGTAFSKTFRNMFSELPVTLWIPAFIFVIVIALTLLLILTVCLGYSWNLHLPFWSGLEIGPPMHALNNRHHEEMVANLRQQIEHQRQMINTLQSHQPTAIEYPGHDQSWGSSIRRLLGYNEDDQSRSPPANRPQNTSAQGETVPNNPSISDVPLPPPSNGSGEGLRRRRPPYPTQLPYPPEPQFPLIHPPVHNLSPTSTFNQNIPESNLRYDARANDGDLFMDTVECRSSVSPGSPVRPDSSSVPQDPESLGDPPPYEEAATSFSPPTREIGFTRRVLEGTEEGNTSHTTPNTNPTPTNVNTSSSNTSDSGAKNSADAKAVETLAHEDS